MHQPWLGGNSSLPFHPAGVKKGHDRELEGARSCSPLAMFSGSSHSVISLFLTSPRGWAGSVSVERRLSRDFVTVRDGVMLDLSMMDENARWTPCERAAGSAQIPGRVSGEHWCGCSYRGHILPHPSIPSHRDVGMGNPRLPQVTCAGWGVEVLLLPFAICFLFFSCLPANKQKVLEFPAAVDCLSFKSHCFNF